MKQLNEVSTLAFEMDSDLGLMYGSVTSLKDVEVLLGEVVEGMETEINRNGRVLDHEDYLRRLRVLWNLLCYTAKDLNRDFDKIHQANNSIIDEIKKENSLAGNETA